MDTCDIFPLTVLEHMCYYAARINPSSKIAHGAFARGGRPAEFVRPEPVALHSVGTPAGEVVRLPIFVLRSRNSDRDIARNVPSLAVANDDCDGVGTRR